MTYVSSFSKTKRLKSIIQPAYRLDNTMKYDTSFWVIIEIRKFFQAKRKLISNNRVKIEIRKCKPDFFRN